MSLRNGFHFGDWTARPDLGTLSHGHDQHHLEPKLMDLLVLLAEHGGQVVPKETIREAVWGDAFVGESGLARNISQLRKCLGDDPKQPQYIETIPKRGYRWLMETSLLEASIPGPTAQNPAQSADPSQTREQNPLPFYKMKILLTMLVLLASLPLIYDLFRTSESPEHVDDPSIAVMPFRNLSPEQDAVYFSEGLADEILNMLYQVEHLKVIGRTSSFALQDRDAQTAGRELKVNHVLEGSVRRDGDRIRVTAQLVDQQGFQVWSQQYDRQLGSLFDIQEDIARSVVDGLKLSMISPSAPVSMSYRGNMEAYDYYLLGQYYCHDAKNRDFLKAVDYFLSAVAADPTYPQAYAALSRTWIMQGLFLGKEPAVFLEPAAKAAEKALELDQKLDEAHAVNGLIAVLRDYNWQEGEAAMERAVALNPINSVNRVWYSMVLMGSGRAEDAQQQLRQALDYDPASAITYQLLAQACQASGDLDGADRALDRVLELSPGDLMARLSRIYGMGLAGRWEEALGAYQALDPAEQINPIWHACALANAGEEDTARKMLLEMKRQRENGVYLPPYSLAQIHLALGEDERAFQWLQAAQDIRDPTLTLFLATNPEVVSRADDQRLDQFKKAMNLH